MPQLRLAAVPLVRLARQLNALPAAHTARAVRVYVYKLTLQVENWCADMATIFLQGSGAPDPAAVVIHELLKQRGTLLASNPSGVIQAVEGSFTSPLAQFMPIESQACHFKLLKPPRGATPAKHACGAAM